MQIAKIGIAIKIRGGAIMIGFRYCWETYDFIILRDNRIGRAIVFLSLGTFILQGLVV